MATRSAVSSIFKTLWIFSLGDFVAGLTCSYDDYGGTSYMFCLHGCCGTFYSRSCCVGTPVTFDYTTILIGAVIGGIAFIAVVVGSTLYYKKYHHRRTVVVAPRRNKNIRVNTTTASTSSAVPTIQPSLYVATTAYPPPPQSMASHPAYPPPPPTYAQPSEYQPQTYPGAYGGAPVSYI